MRCNQVSIFIERFGKYVPKNYPADVQRISVYCDDGQSVYAALSKAYACAINELNEYEHIGARCDVSTNEFSHVDYRTMHGVLPNTKRKYGQDFDFDYFDTAKILHKDYIWTYENMAEILDELGKCESAEDFAPRLKERFGLDDVQIRKLSQIRLDMLTKERYDAVKAEVEKIEEKERDARTRPITADMASWTRRKIAECKREIAEIEAFQKATDNYSEIMGIIMDSNNDREYADKMQEKYGFDVDQSRALRFCCANDFSRGEQEKKEKQLSELKERLAEYEKDLREYKTAE